MAVKDKYHYKVIKGLTKEEWRITDDPLILDFGGVNLEIDLGAEKVIGAEKNGTKIAIEVKSFLQASPVTEFHAALGQYLHYQMVLEAKEPERTLYLAVPLNTYESFFVGHFAQTSIRHHALKLIVYDPKQEVLVQWIE